MAEKFAFLTSFRFWSIVIGSLSLYLKAKGYIGEPEMILIATITGGFVAVRTVDRAAEKIGGTESVPPIE